jgi:anaerobic magnesium-protoporphyrin IX monomethyl ester cyclase
MARVFLLNPPSPEPVKTPLLAFCHLASALRAAGHQVALLDASAPHAPHDAAAIEAHIRGFAPDLVGLHLKTLQVQPAYALVPRLRAIAPLVAGGPHATICPDEPFGQGFSFVIRGEAEPTLPALADALDGKQPFDGIEGLSFAGPLGPRHNPPRDFLRDLDALPSPVDALDLFDPAWYGAAAPLAPAGLLSSRGCPAACTFCANNVTGRRFRYRSPGSIVAEIERLQDRFGMCAFSFFDDSFAVGHRRIRELCGALRRLRRPVYWTCTAHPAHLDLETLSAMKRAGCGGVDIGMESGDPGMLLRIGKGVTVERVLDVLGWCRDLGLHSVVNLMFGWPDESDAELEATCAFMDRAAPLAGGFNARGVLIPHPGTEIYDRHHARFGFTQWWLREEPLIYPPFPAAWSAAEVARCYAEDPALDRNFFRHPPHRVARIREALNAKAYYTLRQIERPYAPFTMTVPAAGAR